MDLYTTADNNYKVIQAANRSSVSCREMEDYLMQQMFAAGILTDLSKAFDTVNHELLIAKLHAYGFNKGSLKMLCSYLTNR